jgi:competence protein ComEC
VRDIFPIIFLSTLFFLVISHSLLTDPGTMHISALVSFLIAIVLFILDRTWTSCIFIVLAFSFILCFQFLRLKNEYLRDSQFYFPEDEYVSLVGVLTEYPEEREEFSFIRIKTRILECNRQRYHPSVNLKIRVKGSLRNFYKGDLIRVNAKLFKYRLNRNFVDDHRDEYNLLHLNHAGGFCKSAQMVFLKKRTSFFWFQVGKWRNRVREFIERMYRRSGVELDRKGMFLEAILLGDRGRMDSETREGLKSSGVYHLLSVSGAHIGILAVFSLTILRIFGVGYKSRYICSGLFLLIFLMISGFRIPAQRAVIMALFIFLARILYERVRVVNIISLTGLILLWLNPAEFLDAGFVLTFSLTLAIVLGRKIFLPLLARLPKFLAELLSVNLSAALMSLPLSLYFFNRFSLASLVSGLILFPLTALIVALSCLILFIAVSGDGLAMVCLSMIDAPLGIFFWFVELFSNHLDLNLFRRSPPLLFIVIIFVLFALLSSEKMLKKIQRVLAGLVVLLLTFLLLFKPHYASGKLESYFFDVGQGDSACIVFPNGCALLIDGGGSGFSDFEIGRSVLLPFLIQKGISVRWVAISHFHPDHAKGIYEIIKIIKPEELWISSRPNRNHYFHKILENLPDSTKIREITSGFSLKIGRCRVDCLHPDSVIHSGHTHNNHSQVLKISDPFHSFLFTGDVENEVEHHLAKSICQHLQATVLKVAHHGSSTSTTSEFVDCVKPRVAIVSCGRRNRFNFPSPVTVKTLKKAKVKIFYTSRSGGIKIISRPKGIIIETAA